MPGDAHATLGFTKFYAITAAGRTLRVALLDVWKNQNRVLDEITKEIPHV